MAVKITGRMAGFKGLGMSASHSSYTAISGQVCVRSRELEGIDRNIESTRKERLGIKLTFKFERNVQTRETLLVRKILEIIVIPEV